MSVPGKGEENKRKKVVVRVFFSEKTRKNDRTISVWGVSKNLRNESKVRAVFSSFLSFASGWVKVETSRVPAMIEKKT